MKLKLDIFKNRFITVILALSVFLTAFTGGLFLLGKGNVLNAVVKSISYPFEVLFSSVTKSFEGYSKYFSAKSELIRENERLKTENEKLSKELNSVSYAKDENGFLKKYLGIEENSAKLGLCDASVIAVSGNSYSHSVTLNKGTLNGIKVNMPVITENGLVGYVKEVGFSWCRVLKITDGGINVSVTDKNTGAYGILSGYLDYSLTKRNDSGTEMCIMNNIPEALEIGEGDVITTSGKGSVYPPDITVGVVVEVLENQYNRTKSAIVSPSVDFSSLGRVMIITHYEGSE